MDYVPNNFKSLSDLFDCTLTDLKGSIPLWDDLVIKITRLHAATRGVVQANSSFLESFQKIADLATNSSALASKDIGTSLTRLSLRQRSLHVKMKTMNENMACRIIDPMQQRLDEWKRCNLQIDKDRIKETRRAKSELKKASEEKNRLQKKALKRGSMKGLGALQMQVEVALKEAADKYQALENIEYDCVRRVVIEERSRFCYFVNCIMPVLECQINMFSEIQTLEEIKNNITSLIENPNSLTQSSEDLIRSIIRPLTLSSMDAVVAASIAYSTTPPLSTDTASSEGSLISSRKSSVLSINSEASSHSGGGNNILIHRRSRSESPTNVLREHESDEIFIEDATYENTDLECLPQDPGYATIYPMPYSEKTNGDVASTTRDYDSVTLKRPKGNRGPQTEDELLLLSNLSFQPETPNVNANYSALYQLHHPIGRAPTARKFSASTNRNGDMYPDYHTIHSPSAGGSGHGHPRRMTVPELPHAAHQMAPSYATIKKPVGLPLQLLHHQGGVPLDQIDECNLPPVPHDDQLINHSLDPTDSDMPLPPPPLDHESETRSAAALRSPAPSSMSSMHPLAPPAAPPPPGMPPPIQTSVSAPTYRPVPTASGPVDSPSLVKQIQQFRPITSNVPPPPAPPPPPPPPAPQQNLFGARRDAYLL